MAGKVSESTESSTPATTVSTASLNTAITTTHRDAFIRLLQLAQRDASTRSHLKQQYERLRLHQSQRQQQQHSTLSTTQHTTFMNWPDHLQDTDFTVLSGEFTFVQEKLLERFDGHDIIVVDGTDNPAIVSPDYEPTFVGDISHIQMDKLDKLRAGCCNGFHFVVVTILLVLAYLGVCAYFYVKDRLVHGPVVDLPGTPTGVAVGASLAIFAICAFFIFLMFRQPMKRIDHFFRKEVCYPIIIAACALPLTLGIYLWARNYENTFDCPSVADDDMYGADDGSNNRIYFYSYAALTTLFVCCVAGRSIFTHLRSFKYHYHQRYIIRVLLVTPIYAVLTLTAVLMHKHAPFFIMIRDFYESYMVYSFYQLIRHYLGENNLEQGRALDHYLLLDAVKENEELLHADPPTGWCGHAKIMHEKKLKDNTSFLKTRLKGISIPGFGELRSRWCLFDPASQKFLDATRKIVLLYIFIRFTTTISAIILYIFHVFCEGDMKNPVYLTIMVLNFCGVCASVGALYILSLSAHPAMFMRGLELRTCDAKFWAVKGMIMLLLNQQYLISGVWFFVKSGFVPTATWSRNDMIFGFQAGVILFELAVFSIIHAQNFGSDPYENAESVGPKNVCCMGNYKRLDAIVDQPEWLYRQRIAASTAKFSLVEALAFALKPSDIKKETEANILHSSLPLVQSSP